MRRNAFAIAALLLSGLLAAKDKPKPEEILAQHLSAIGTEQARAAAKNRIVEGKTHMRLLVGGAGESDGRAVVLSEGEKCRVGLLFDSRNYWGEQFLFDGRKADVGFIQPNVRSPMGSFFLATEPIQREGLLGGTLSTAWPLLDLSARQAKLEYDGLKKLDGRELHQLSYKAKREQGELKIQLFFEQDTYRHVRTAYTITLTPRFIADSRSMGRQQETRFLVEETFSDFQVFDGLTLPTHWTLHFIATTASGSLSQEWASVFDKVRHNQTLDPNYWKLDQSGK